MSEANPAPRRGASPPVFLLVAIVLMVVLHAILPVVQLLSYPWHLSGAVLVVAGLVLNVWADALFKGAHTTVRPFEQSTALLVAGPFALTRNPMYLGMVLVLSGIAVGLGSVTPWLVVPLFVWQVSGRFIAVEERMLDLYGPCSRPF